MVKSLMNLSKPVYTELQSAVHAMIQRLEWKKYVFPIYMAYNGKGRKDALSMKF